VQLLALLPQGSNKVMHMRTVHMGPHQPQHAPLYVPQFHQTAAQQVPGRQWRATAPPKPEAFAKVMVYEHQAKQVLLQTRQPLQVRRQVPQETDDRMQDFGRIPQPLPSRWRVDFELSPAGHELGGGAFAEVFRVQHKRSQKNYAVKVMHRPNFALRGIECQIHSEITAMKKAAYRSEELKEDLHILKLLDVTEEGEYVYLLLELCEQGDLLRKLASEPGQRILEPEVAVIARQLMIGLQRVHELGYIHRDIKPDNLLADAEGRLRIADFGWCCLREDHPNCLAGTLLYMAPEVLKNEPQDVDADIWSAGMTLYQMVVGRPLLQVNLGPGATRLSEHDPHRATEMKQKWLLQEINTVCPPSFESKPNTVSDDCWDFLRQTLTVQRQFRIAISDALQHPWLKTAEKVQEEESEAVAAKQLQLREMTQSPPRPKTAWQAGKSPGKEFVSVPTPEKPRSYDPNRNLAYTPPVSPEPTPERTRWGQQENVPSFQTEKENSADPEVSPERKTRRQSLQKLANKWSSPKDSLTEKLEQPVKMQAKETISKLASPQRALNRRKTIASAAPAAFGEVERVSPIREKRNTQVSQKQVEEMRMSRDGGLTKVNEEVPEVEEGSVAGQTHFSSVKMAVFSNKGLSLKDGDPLGASAPHRKGFVQRFPGDMRIALRVPAADHTKGELLTPRTAERCPQLQGVVPQMPSGGVPGARSAKAFHAAVCLSPQQRYQQASPVRSRQFAQQRGPMMTTTSTPCVSSHMKPALMSQVLHHRVAPVYAPHTPHVPHPTVAAGKQVFVARMPEAFANSMMRHGAPNRR